MLRNVAWLSLASLAVKPFWLLFITVLCARVLGADDYGILNTALSLGALTFALTNLGIGQYTVREVAGDPSLASRFATNFIALRSGLFLPAAALALGVGLVLGYEVELLLAVAFACLFYAAQSLVQYCYSFFQAVEQLQYQARSVVLEKLLVVLAGGILLYATVSPSMTLLGMAGGMSMSAGAALWWVVRRIAPLRRSELDAGFVVDSLRTLMPFAVAGVFGMVYFRVDTVIVEAMMGVTAAGQYGLAFRVVEALNTLPIIVVHATLYPRLSRLFKQESYTELRKIMWIGGASLAVVSVLVAAGIAVVAVPLVGWVATDPALAPAGPTLRLLCWVFPLTCLRTLLYAALLALHEQRFIAAALGVGVALNVGLNIALLPVLGIRGAALATICAELSLMIVYFARYRYRLRSL